MILWLLVISLVTSAMGGMLGMASGVFIVPLLVLTLPIDLQTAIGASLVSVIACSCASAPQFLKARLVNIRLAAVLEIASVAGALTGVLLVGMIVTNVLYLLFAAVMLVSAYQMFANRRAHHFSGSSAYSKSSWQQSLRLDGSLPATATAPSQPYTVRRLPLGLSLMYAAGILSALLGIGSGVLKIPAMDSALRLPIKVSSATSNFMIGVTATASAVAYFMRGEIDTEIAGPVAIGSVVGSVIGAKLLGILPANLLRAIFVAVLLLLAIQMLLTGVGIDLVGVSS